MRIAMLVICAAMYSGCSCQDSNPTDDGGLDLVDAGIHVQCSGVKTFEDADLDGLAAALTAPFPDGASEVALGAGCFRVVRQASAGGLRSVEVRRYSGEADFVISGTDVVIKEKPDKIAVSWDGTTLTTDFDLDGFKDYETVENVGAAGLTKQQSTTYSPSTHAVTQRVTFTPSADAGMMHNLEEVLANGSLVAREWESPALQKQLGQNTCMFVAVDQEVPCADPTALKRQLSDAILEGAKCMQGTGNQLGEDFVKLMILRNLIDSRVDLHCTRQSDTPGHEQYAAAIDTARPGGRIPLYVNADLATCGATFAKSSLFHEMIHLLSGGHDDTLLDRYLSMSMLAESQYTYFDRMRSCEAMCFGTKLKTRCACARCLKTKACDPRCSGMASCLERQMLPDGGTLAIVSEAVGAVCHSGMGSLHRTMAACASACAGGASSCESKSVSCDPTCQ